MITYKVKVKVKVKVDLYSASHLIQTSNVLG